MARTKETRANAAPGAGTIFALRAIGLVLLARWLFSMAQMGLTASLSAMVSSPWACINLVFLFLLIFLPGARAVAERPFHPLPQWLRQALRLFAFLGFLFAVWSVGAFVASAGWRRAAQAVAATNGWLLAAPVLYAAVDVDLPAASVVANQYRRAPVCDRPLRGCARSGHAHGDRVGRAS